MTFALALYVLSGNLGPMGDNSVIFGSTLICGPWRWLAKDGWWSSDCGQGEDRQLQSLQLLLCRHWPASQRTKGQDCEGLTRTRTRTGCPSGQFESLLCFLLWDWQVGCLGIPLPSPLSLSFLQLRRVLCSLS